MKPIRSTQDPSAPTQRECRGPARSTGREFHLPTWLLLVVLHVGCALQAAEPAPVQQAVYQTRSDHHPDGIGKFYLGREIAQVMGHAGMAWLERPEREHEERPDLLIPLLKIQSGAVVADVGAGSGYHTRRLARAVGAAGKVYAVDIQAEMLAALRERMAQEGWPQVVPVLGTEADPRLPHGAIDLVLLVDVYHEFAFPYEMMQAICASLKTGGRVALVEFRANDPQVPIKPLHTMSEEQVRKEMAQHPLEWIETVDTLPWQKVLIFAKPARPDPVE